MLGRVREKGRRLLHGTAPDAPPVPPGQGRPDVSVVVPVYNDALVEQAVASALGQTLRAVEVVVVDHGSTDGTAQLVDRLAADPRVHALHLPDNDGGPGRPLNTGIDAALGRYVTILGSDDELEPDACRALTAAAEVAGADVAAGLTRRIHVHEQGRVQPWFRRLYASRRVLDGIADDPELVWDPISVGKLYKTDWLRDNKIRYPEDVLYEDQYFVMHAWVRAARIALVPDPTYRWMVRTRSGRRSITQGRADISNLRDRVTVARRIDDLLTEHGAGAVKPEKDRRFLRHDLRLYLQELWQRDEEYRREFARIVGPYVATIPDDVIAQEDTMTRVALWLLAQGDLEGTLSAYGYVVGRGRVASELVRDGDRVYWTARHLDTAEGRRRLDVTELGLDRLPPSAAHLYNELTVTGAHDDRLEVEGWVLNQLGMIPETADVRVEVVVKARRGRRQVRFGVERLVRDGARLRFSAVLDLGTRLDIQLRRTQIFDLYVQTSWDGRVNLTRTTATATGWPGVAVEVRSPRRLLAGDTLVPYATQAGNLSLQLTHSGEAAARVGEAAARVARSRPVRRARDTYGTKVRPRAERAYYDACRRLPVRQDTVVFESFQGRQYSDSPRAVYEALRLAHPRLDVVWSYSGRRGSSGFPKDARLVRRGSFAYYKALATAGYWVDNFGMPFECPPRPETTYVQTWHGTPLKTLFFDTARLRELPADKLDRWQQFVDRWDYVVIPNDYYASTFLRSSNTRAVPIRAGLPRNDALVTRNDPAAVERLRLQLGLPTDRRIVLYAPTYRARSGPGAPEFHYPRVEELAQALGEDHFVLLRQHYYRRPMRVPTSLAWFARDVSSLDEMSDLLLVSDVLVTDYSSVAFDYALLRRPMVFYAPDLEHYSNVEPGTYVDLARVAPGPVVATTDAVVEAVRASRDDPGTDSAAYDEFVRRFCAADNGHAAQVVVERVWGPGQSGRS